MTLAYIDSQVTMYLIKFNVLDIVVIAMGMFPAGLFRDFHQSSRRLFQLIFRSSLIHLKNKENFRTGNAYPR